MRCSASKCTVSFVLKRKRNESTELLMWMFIIMATGTASCRYSISDVGNVICSSLSVREKTVHRVKKRKYERANPVHTPTHTVQNQALQFVTESVKVSPCFLIIDWVEERDEKGGGCDQAVFPPVKHEWICFTGPITVLEVLDK